VKGREIEEKLRIVRGGRLLFLPHAIQQMTRPERMISRQEIRNVVEHGEMHSLPGNHETRHGSDPHRPRRLPYYH